MTKAKKRCLIIISCFLIFIFVSGLFSVYFSYFHHYKGTAKVDNWYVTDEFKLDNVVTLQKDKNKDFVILNLADIQLCDIEDFFNRSIIHKEITYLVNQSKPDLITLTGDQTWSNENLMSLRCLISWLEEYEIPYAPIFGNHDYGNEYDSAVAGINYCCDLYENAKHCLFKRGPTNLDSLGNYVINIMEGDKIFKTIYMLDAGYNDEITDQQISWFNWNANGIKIANNNEYTQGICFMHKPLPEYTTAYRNYYFDHTIAINNVYDYCSLSGTTQNGFFDIAKSCGITDIICGHQHTNNMTLQYENVRLTFALKTGELSFYYCDENINLNGATVLTLNDTTTISNIYVDKDQFHIKNSRNIYNE